MTGYLLLDNQKENRPLAPIPTVDFTDGNFYFEWKEPFSIEKINTYLPRLLS